MFTFKVDTLVSIFTFIVRQLLKTAEKLVDEAQAHQDIIDKASADKNKVLQEVKRAQAIADKVQALIS